MCLPFEKQASLFDLILQLCTEYFSLTLGLGSMLSDPFLIFFEMFVLGKIRSANLFFDVASFISRCHAGLSGDASRLGVTKILQQLPMVSPAIKRELQLFLYVFSSKFLQLWESPGFVRALFINSDLLVFRRFSFDSVLRESLEFFANLLILEDQEVNNCQFKKFQARFLGVLQQHYRLNQNALVQPCVSAQALFESYFDFYSLLFSVKTAFLEPKKFSECMGLSQEPRSRELFRQLVGFFKLGENFFKVDKCDFAYLGRSCNSRIS